MGLVNIQVLSYLFTYSYLGSSVPLAVMPGVYGDDSYPNWCGHGFPE